MPPDISAPPGWVLLTVRSETRPTAIRAKEISSVCPTDYGGACVVYADKGADSYEEPVAEVLRRIAAAECAPAATDPDAEQIIRAFDDLMSSMWSHGVTDETHPAAGTLWHRARKWLEARR